MSIQLDLTTTTPCQNFDSAQGRMTLQNHRIIDVDNEIAQIFGYRTREELLFNVEFVYALVPDSYQELAKKRYLEAIKGKLKKGKLYTDIPANGRNISIFCLSHIIELNSKPALQVTIIDITSVVEAQRKRNETDRMYRKLLNTSKQGILIHRNFKPLMVNQAWVEQQGADSIEQVLAMDSILSIVPEDQRSTAIRRCENILNGNTPNFSSVVSNQCFDGTHKYFNLYDNVINWEGEDAIQVILEEVTDKILLERELLHRAMHDDLTHVFNRRAIYDWLKKPVNQHMEMACLLIDIDDFKSINDRFGHTVGDTVIRHLADIIKTHIELLGGVVGRWGGEEFIVFIPKAKSAHTKIISERICHTFNQHTFFGINRRAFTTSVSIGVTNQCECHSANTIDTLIRVTDDALYRAKANGKNQVSINDDVVYYEALA
ncbi:diguanylate cyclase [Vibrio splendidus]|uniref:sensor domain-containing diguanylate cyclase n=1 Tax=Vibrio splendidus TaxID=29497 RepID=UPI000C83A2CF|nr:sensor domain-containing diguanylate cyclase [Vibrio splendidus]PMH69429.1 diguanylate cyclase [Vibrio splendidus]PMJ23791.1 diguanylate cyclase [Vibrio splendidus]